MLPHVSNFAFPLIGNNRYVVTRVRTFEWTPNVPDWLVRMRGKRLQEAVAAEVSARGNVRLTRTWLSRLENGARPSAELLGELVDYYGSEPPAYEPESGEGRDASSPALSDLLARLDAQERAITRLAAALEKLVTLPGFPDEDPPELGVHSDRIARRMAGTPPGGRHPSVEG